MRVLARGWLVVGLVVMVALLGGAVVRADGYVITESPGTWAIMADQKAIIAWQDGHQELILSVSLDLTPQQSGEQMAWVIPVPSQPQVEVIPASIFAELDLISQPEVIYKSVQGDGPGLTLGSDAAPGSVEVLERKEVGVYDVAVLTGEQAGDLLDWLHEQGFQVPDALMAPMQDYIAEGWSFVAMRIAPDAADWQLQEPQPIWLSFDSPQMVYPMRLTAAHRQNLALRLYILADHRYELDGFAVEFAGRAEIDPFGQDLAEALSDEAFFTKLFNPAVRAEEMAVDFYPQQAANDEAFRETVVHTYVSTGMGGRAAPLEWLCPCGLCWLGLVGVLVVLLGVIAMLKRRKRWESAEGGEAEGSVS